MAMDSGTSSGMNTMQLLADQKLQTHRIESVKTMSM